MVTPGRENETDMDVACQVTNPVIPSGTQEREGALVVDVVWQLYSMLDLPRLSQEWIFPLI